MANADTVKSITDNLQSVLQGQGVKFSRKGFDDEKNIPGALIPFGEVRYKGEEFEYTHGQRAGYAEINYLIKVVLSGKNHIDMMREEQGWVHKIRDAITVNALNAGDLASAKPVSRVAAEKVSIENKGDIGFLNYEVKIRYRQVN